MTVSPSYVIINYCNKAVYKLDDRAYGTMRVPMIPFGTLRCDFVVTF